jgi:Mlc titration factor MtfA (ptsG expression regulator)
VLRAFRRWLKRHASSGEERPFPPAWRAIIDANVPMVSLLSEEDQRELERLVMTFLDEKSFEGAGGLEMTDEIRVTVAAQACVLILRRDTEIYPDLDAIVVYPSAYVATQRTRVGSVVLESEGARLGESWTRGLVVLAWDAVLRGTTNPHAGHNVVLHEFAHQLDHEGGVMDGAPDLGERARYATWAEVLGQEYADLVDRVHAGRPTSIDEYGATSPPEFFAVITEMFFERPLQLRSRHPDLYATLADFYEQDPASLRSPRAAR